MREAYLIASTRGNVSSLSTHSHAGQVRPILQELFEKSGLPARRVQALHWHGGEQDFWLPSLDRSQGAGESQEPKLGFVPAMARFQWPAVPLLTHATLQSVARSIEAGDVDAVLLAQESGEQAAAILLASPELVGVYNLSPRAIIRQKLVLSGAPSGLLKAAWAALQKVRQDETEQDPAVGPAQEPASARIEWLAADKRLEPSAEEGTTGDIFPGARWINLDRETPGGDLFLIQALVECLEKEKAQCGLLLSEGPQRSGLGTLLERI